MVSNVCGVFTHTRFRIQGAVSNSFLLIMADQPSHSAVSDSPPLLIFAYGTLMTGYGNNRLLDGAQSLGRAHTCESSFRMYHAGVPFVGRVEEGGVSVAGEVFAVSDAAMLNKLDNLEGHPDWCVLLAASSTDFLF